MTLTEHIAELEAEIARLTEQCTALHRELNGPAREAVAAAVAAKNGAYTERNMCVALIARMADHLSTQDPAFGAWLAKHDPADTAWERDWLNIVFVRIPTGQLSWHLHDSELPLFDFLPRVWDCAHDGFTPWDGHTTEQKYDRIRAALKADGLDVP